MISIYRICPPGNKPDFEEVQGPFEEVNRPLVQSSPTCCPSTHVTSEVTGYFVELSRTMTAPVSISVNLTMNVTAALSDCPPSLLHSQ